MITSLIGDSCPYCGNTRKNIIFDNLGVISAVKCSICDSALPITEREAAKVIEYVTYREYNEYP